MVLIVSTGAGFHVYPAQASTSYAIHSPIQIIGNSEFTQPNGVTGGTGTPKDPYQIRGWSIASQNGQAAIRIESTNAHFLISQVQLLNAQPGVYLTGVANGAVENSTLMNSNFGIRIESSTNIIISGNSISGYFDGVYSADILSAPQTTGLTIANNTFSTAGAVVDSSQSLPSNLNITGNTFQSTGVSTASYGATVARNDISGGGLTVEGNNSVVTDNLVASAIVTNFQTGGDIQVWGTGTIVTNNRAERIVLIAATGITLTDNVLTKGVLISTYAPFDTPPFYDSHTMTGNTVNGKPVLYIARCSGTNIDGTSAGEVIVASCTNIRVANLRLSGAGERIMMVYVNQASIVGNNISGDGLNSIEILHSSNLQMTGNDLNRTSVSISNTDNVTLAGNLGTGGTSSSIVAISAGSGIFVSNNTLGGSTGAALSLVNVVNATVAGNWVSDSANGVVVSGSNGLNITANNIVRNELGLTLDLGSLNGIFNGVIYHNNFVDNSQHQAAYYPQVVTAFDDGYPSGGNFWSDYRAIDNCSGPQQNICTGPDGIGDRPYTGLWEFQYRTGGSQGTLVDRYPLVDAYGNFSWDTAPPSWPSGSALTVSVVNSTNLTLQWKGAVDDAWVSGYRIYEDGTLSANLPRYYQNYTVAHLSPGSMHTFKVEAGDLARHWSTDGPSASATLPQAGTSTSQPLLTLSWWMANWYIGLLIGAAVAFPVTWICLVRRRKLWPFPRKD